MESLMNYLRDPRTENLPSAKQLDMIELQYPWFTAVYAVRSLREGVVDPRLAVAMQMGKCSSLFMKKIEAQEFLLTKKVDLIGKFLEKGEYKIVPQDNTPDYHQDSETNMLADDDMITEELAEIFVSQGLNEQAKEAYRKLSLLYPEKSVYFAEIIAKIGGQ